MTTRTLSALEIARLAHGTLHEAPASSPLLLLVQEDDDGVTFLTPPPSSVEGLDLFDQAVGVEAPRGCGAVAMAATGRAWPAVGGALDVVVAHALLRSGASATYLTDVEGEPLLDDEVGGGLVPDLCRRVLGLPTTPPEQETDAYLSRLWLDRLLVAASAAPGSLRVDQAMALHPIAGDVDATDAATWLRLALASHRFAAAVPWAVLRRRFAAEGEGRAAEAARWFDDGSFSRWMLARLPTPDDALAALEQLVVGAVHREVVATVGLADDLGRG